MRNERQFGNVRAERGRLWAAVGACVLACGLAAPAYGGGGPENVVVVVNSRSWASLTVANHFVALRKIPPANVVHVDYGGNLQQIRIGKFRDEILKPVLQAVEQRRLAGHIDYIVYSTDFPYAVDAREDVEGIEVAKVLQPMGSINGFTYLMAYTMNESAGYLNLRSNNYMRSSLLAEQQAQTHAFRHQYGWNLVGNQEPTGTHYMLSTMLGYTTGRGNSVSEVVEYLRRSAGADGTQPEGTIYFAENDDIRSQKRHRVFPAAVAALEKEGVEAKIVRGVVPTNAADVQGLMVGAAKFDWPGSLSTIQPGAICEHFTSTGGMMSWKGKQTPLTEFLRYGAAASSGAVIEPYAIAEKFPFPFMQVHYARGCSAAESFYQSVHGPYQLLIVGDPLCQPWATFPEVMVEGIAAGDELVGAVSIRPRVVTQGKAGLDRFDLFIDGQRATTCGEGETLEFDTSAIPDGHHEFRVVAVETGPIETQGRVILPVTSANHGRAVSVSLPDGVTTVRRGQPIRLQCEAEGAEQIVIVANSQVVAAAQGSEATLTVDSRRLGLGPVALRATAVFAGEGAQRAALGEPIDVEIAASTPLPAIGRPDGRLIPGVRVTTADGETSVAQATAATKWLEELGVQVDEPYTVTGYFEAASDDVYQFLVRHTGSAEIKIDEQLVYRAEPERPSLVNVPVTLRAGLHRFELSGTCRRDARLLIEFGGPGSRTLGKENFRCLR